MDEVAKILVVEDDEGIITVVRDVLQDAGYACDMSMDGIDGMQRGTSGGYDLIILDIALPKLNGLDVCRQVKAAAPDLPIIMLTARSEEADVVAGLEVGADDYVLKPFRPKELLARVRARLRDATQKKIRAANPAFAAPGSELAPSGTIAIGDLTIDTERMRVLKRGEALSLSAREYQIVALLAMNAGRPFGREELLEKVWDFAAEDYGVNVSVMMSRLRRKIEDDQDNPKYLLTVRGIGYRFVEASEIK